MTRVALIGARGFVGSAFASHIASLKGHEVVEVTRGNYERLAGVGSDIVIDASCNSRKYLAEENPHQEFALSVAHRMRTLRDFPGDLQVHISSVDVYGDLTSPSTTREEPPSNTEGASHYGFHKLLAEQLVRHYSKNWLILRLGGMVGPGLRKNPVFDILSGEPLRIHPDSQYQYMTTGDVARIAWMIVERGLRGETFNICGTGLIAPREIASIAGRKLNLAEVGQDHRPRVVDVDTTKVSQIVVMPETRECITRFVTASSDGEAQGADTYG
jgi:nucleoside-diphosphate-sugar epimerase